MSRRGWLTVLAAGLLFLVLAGGLIWRALSVDRAAPLDPTQIRLQSATMLDDERPLPPFELVREGGHFANSDLMGRWTLLFFGYTFCPDICPTALHLLKELRSRLAERAVVLPQVVMVSVDPRDDPQTLSRYTSAFDPDFIGATADDAGLAPLVQHLGVYYLRHDRDGKPDYAVDHSAAIYLIDPRGHLQAVFPAPQTLSAMLQDVLAVVR
ncbi:SCO family protein [Accumulibacter sp.]|uniref:SCO family protein n=1 Tax=Accumulibacter sp. TaxID=2053492 RepID=UPI0025DC043B|nr:SCO family protein [Accumulibacter sp.]MCM8611017.1 SCO family protein [Accumulibacter sp.]MCM8634837.1 SCO family protein [Accumulibacter sp.]MCM8638391.1 SCO family protein [Accumulibacter sp.]